MKRIPVLAALMLLATTTAAQASDAISNWAAPSSWTPPAARAAGRSALVTFPPLPFIPITPCRMIDTRAGSGFPAGYGPPSIAGGAQRTFTITGQCGIPAAAQAVSFNFAVWIPTTRGDLRVFPAGGAVPVVSTLNWESGILALANAAVVPLGTSGAITVLNDGTTVDIFADVNGYYASDVGASTFTVTSSGYGIVGAGTAIGVEGVNTGGAAGFGVAGLGGAGVGATGQSTSSVGVFGLTQSTSASLAGVLGVDGAVAASAPSLSAGVRGIGQIGVVGVTNTMASSGVLGVALSPATLGVFAQGNLGASGAKPFIEPHPTDPALTIRYVALEGPEAGTYFRGTSHTLNHEAVIEVPESFRMVTDEEGLTVQLTPVGELAEMAVMSQSLSQIVVRSSREVTFHYHVNGIRRAFKDWQAVAEGQEFRPHSPGQKVPGWLTKEARSRLIANGTYNSDGTVNMMTAERLGWAQQWRADEAKAKIAREVQVGAEPTPSPIPPGP